MAKVMVFGVFDGLHEGHKQFLTHARALGDYLCVVVAQDHVVEQLKGGLPNLNLAERFEHLETVDGVDQVLIGDHLTSAWQVVKEHKPDIIALGHDQEVLADDLKSHMSELGYTPHIEALEEYEVNKGLPSNTTSA